MQQSCRLLQIWGDYMKTVIRKIIEYIIIFMAGAITYLLIEICWRGYTHWTMGILGGIVIVLVGLINEVTKKDLPLIIQAPMASIIITLVEYWAGYILNIQLGMNIWDYSDLPLNVDGQVCLYFSLLWMVLGIVASILDDLIRWRLFGEEKPHIKFI